MGKKNRRRPAGKKGKKKKDQHPQQQQTAAAVPANLFGIGGAYGQMELLRQCMLLEAGRDYIGMGHGWAKRDESLLGDLQADGDGLYKVAPEEEGGEDGGDADGFEEGSKEALKAALGKVWSDRSISDPHGAGLAMGPKRDWMEWALDMAETPDRVELFLADYDNDKEMHKSTLERLSKEEEGGHRGSLDYISALNCILQDAFQRIRAFNSPPSLNLYQATMMRMEEGQPLYKVRMETWKGYERLALAMTEAVRTHPLVPKPEPPPSWRNYEPAPLADRGEFPPTAFRFEENEREDEEDCYRGIGCGRDLGGACGFSAADVEYLLAQGVKPWDDDADDVLFAHKGYVD